MQNPRATSRGTKKCRVFSYVAYSRSRANLIPRVIFPADYHRRGRSFKPAFTPADASVCENSVGRSMYIHKRLTARCIVSLQWRRACHRARAHATNYCDRHPGLRVRRERGINHARISSDAEISFRVNRRRFTRRGYRAFRRARDDHPSRSSNIPFTASTDLIQRRSGVYKVDFLSRRNERRGLSRARIFYRPRSMSASAT